MKYLLSRLSHRVNRPGQWAGAAALASALLLCLLSHWWIHHQQLESERAQMNARGERFVERLEQIFGQLRDTVDALQAQPLRGCGPATLKLLRQVGFDHRFVDEAAYVKGPVQCASRDSATLWRRPADIVGPVYSYWLNSTTEPDDDIASLILGRGEFRVSSSRGHLSDVVELPPDGSLLMVLDQGRRAVPVLGPAQAWPPTWAPGENTLQVTADQLIYWMDTRSPDYQLVLITPRADLPPLTASALWLLYPFSVLLALAVGWGVFHAVAHRRTLGSALQGALRRGEIRVLYQPIVDLGTRRCIGAEALVRWRRMDGSLTSPELFIPVAEDNGQIRQITDFVLQSVLDQLGSLLRAHPHLYISVNLAACDVEEPRIAAVAQRLLKSYRVAPQQITFEVTERGLIDVDAARHTLQALRENGHRILIDDFGTGYSSLAYLHSLPVDALKIDKAFVGMLGFDVAHSGLALHIIRMAHALGMGVIAEGIESEDQAVLLHGEGVDYGQGWLFAEPLSARQLRQLVAKGLSQADPVA
ncbi:EAL domain-containing protein [Pseudomonas typographi]|uniref:cyclic-guanylate-specific phosphodiesterase n=1 Tax=Pseudomonas typographi TaxID=2715964 RepID=A0ABR7Z491_9PSED|nr:EAL domain-containing protein [Pseudomonas typographi]MBD1552958.1 EAL domain-containing protein [Pseudomonas typographi]MBD1600304.1 EAL domain-containing protein [Pseudomonas typographi]